MIVVGVDGSRAGLEAVAWAAAEAALRDVPLRVVHAIHRWAAETEQGRYAEVAHWMRQGAATVLAAAVDRARRAHPKLTVESRILPGDPRAALIREGEQADLLVVGNHGLSAVRGLMVGSVAYGVAGHAPCDVVVVRQTPVTSSGEIVAGIDTSPRAAPVLEFAFAEAALRGADLRAVHVWSRYDKHGGFQPIPDDVGEDEKNEVRQLKETLAGWCGRYPDVTVIEEVVRGHPVDALRDAARGADLLVVGSRGRGELAGLVLGSVSHSLLHHAPGPLAVIRTSAEARRGNEHRGK
ncbi:universal stress protein [Nonomuraea sp. NPDC059194]|uniref:universal stress protein n=1 Tax=Nonomuraea sp. NPDC059194 TaxID=3346764 RepID=UPI00369A2679